MIRFFDFLLSFLGLVLLTPLFIIISLAIALESKGSVLFLQKRVGLNGSEFILLKFRTMRPSESDRLLITTIKDKRITKVGGFLRKYKLDELPQLVNVLKGDMSIVGPRPEVPEYVKYYNPEQRKILSIKPGITDYASIKFSDESIILAEAEDPQKLYIEKIMPQKIRLNYIFLHNRSLGNYFKIIIRTTMLFFK
jgi:lipopolysaccharide/colanic/teichoic acid biosynthesis glycosyltransferase